MLLVGQLVGCYNAESESLLEVDDEVEVQKMLQLHDYGGHGPVYVCCDLLIHKHPFGSMIYLRKAT